MPILLPLLTFALAFLSLAGIRAARAEPSNRLAFLQAAGFVGAYMVLSAELLSVFGALNATGLSFAWTAAIIAIGGWGWQRGWLSQGRAALTRSFPTLSVFEIAALVGFGLIMGLLFLVAVLSPPNNTDSLLYHMSRVAHWAQNGSLGHYATGYRHQLTMPIFAELGILNASVLLGSDRLANLVQWLSLGGTLLGVTLIARILGVGRIGQLAAAAFALSIPMGLLQATSTQNDYVVAFWLTMLACFATLRAVRRLTLGEELAFGVALALGLLTKGTYYPYALPIVLWFFIHQMRSYGWRKSFARGLLIAIPVLVLNLGFWARNLATFGGPLGPSEWVISKVFDSKEPLVMGSALVRNIAMHFVTPSEELNAEIVQLFNSTLGAFDPNLVGLQLIWSWNHEDLAANPLHIILVAITVLGLVFGRRRLPGRPLTQYSLVAGATLVMLSIVVKPDVWGIRLQLPHWVLWAPIFGVVILHLGRRYVASAAVIALLLAAIPWTLFNSTRPLIGMQLDPKGIEIPCFLSCTRVGSILEVPETDLLFANWRHLEDSFLRAAAGLRGSSCKDVGLRIDSYDKEYWLWWLLDARQSGTRIESVYPLPGLEHLADPDFRPCAIVCTVCGDRIEIHGLPLYENYGEVKLYIGDNYSPNAY